MIIHFLITKNVIVVILINLGVTTNFGKTTYNLNLIILISYYTLINN